MSTGHGDCARGIARRGARIPAWTLPALLVLVAGWSHPQLQQHAPTPQPRQPADQLPAPQQATSKQQATTRGLVIVDSLWSQSLGTHKRLLAWLPPSYATDPDRRYPVAYYLHGIHGDESNWTALAGLDATLDSLVTAGMPEMIVVMPDGDDGFYTTWNSLGDYAGCRRRPPPGRQERESIDTYCVPWPHYDDYIARDLVAHVDRTWRTLADRRHRGIAGLSMGGLGAVSLALGYPHVFSAAASHSGILALSAGTVRNTIPAGRFDLGAIQAAYGGLWDAMPPVMGTDSVSWAARDPRNLAARLLRRQPDAMPALLVDCGVDDPFLVQSRAFRDAMAARGVPVEYAEHPGGHTWDYWRRHVATSAAWLATRLSVP
jgi:S-formylglutathione hydrolase FrmB